MPPDILLDSDFLPAERMSPELLLTCNRLVCSWPPLTRLMQYADFGIALLNEQRQVVYANHAALQLAQQPSESPVGQRPGELFGCRNAITRQGGCGTSLACRACRLAKSIQDALAWGQGAAVQEILVGQSTHTPLRVRMYNYSVLVGHDRLLLCRIGDFTPLTPATPVTQCPIELLELYCALTEPLAA